MPLVPQAAPCGPPLPTCSQPWLLVLDLCSHLCLTLNPWTILSGRVLPTCAWPWITGPYLTTHLDHIYLPVLDPGSLCKPALLTCARLDLLRPAAYLRLIPGPETLPNGQFCPPVPDPGFLQCT